MGTNAVIFPGQGAQLVGMGRDVCAEHPVAADTYREADQVLGFALSDVCFVGPSERLDATDIQQPAIFTTSVAFYRAALAAGVFKPEDFQATGGLSLGEYAALHVAGALSFADALRLVYKRGQLMQTAAEQNVGGMVSLLGGDEARVQDLCAAVASEGRVQPANFNCPGQIVISGDRAACEVAAARAESFGFRAVPLKVAGAFHSAHMQSAADGLAAVLAETPIETPKLPVISNVNAEYHTTPAEIRAALVQQVVSPVRWQACVERLIRDGVTAFYEVGPNRHLTGMLRKIDRRMKCTNISTAADLAPTN